MKCPQCKFKYQSPELIQPMFVNGKYIDMCPICALKLRNETAGLPADTPFTGTRASELYDLAIEERELAK